MRLNLLRVRKVSKNLVFDDIPSELLLLIFLISSKAPNKPKENTIKIKNQLKEFFRSLHKSIPENIQLKLTLLPW